MNLNKRITGGIFLVVIIFTLCQGFVMYSIISSTGEREIQTMNKDEMNKTKQELKNYVDIAYNIVESNYENSHDKKWLQKEYGLHLSKIIDITESIIKEHIALVSEGKINRDKAQQRVLHTISQLRYDADTGYVWINKTGQAFSRILIEPQSDKLSDGIPSEMGMGYVWVNDMGKPYPKMLMHPTIPSLDGTILDDKKFNCALGIKKNLFVAMVDVVEKGGDGFVDYVWPKPTSEGLTKEMPKLSYVRIIPEWNWVIGTGIYVDDALEKAIENSKQDLRKMRYGDGEGYFWINDKGSPYPVMVMHPTMPGLDGKVMDDPKFNVALGQPRHLFKAIIKAAKSDGGGFVNYIWPKPTKEGLTSEEPKLSYVRTFEPFGWIIGTGVYIDSIDRMIKDKIKTIKSTNYYLLLTILSVATVLFLFLTIASYFLIDRLFIRKINQANDDLQLKIDEKKKTEKELIIARKHSEVANLAKSEFLANMSHEIRTPLNAVVGLAHLLTQTDLNVQQEDYLSKITLSADNLLSIINDILDISKIEAGKLELETVQFSLRSDILQNVTQVVGLHAAEKGLEVMLDMAPDLPDQLVGDPVRLRQILINLINNAVKFTEQGEVTLIIRKLDSPNGELLYRFDIRDTGIGMTQEQLSGLFKAFSQADASTTRKFGGTGLGLAISKTLAEMMGGEIGASSVHGKGSTFWFTAGFTTDSETVDTEQPTLADDIRELKVLVVDDNGTARAILSRQLEHFGYTVTEAKSGEEAIRRLDESHDSAFDLILLDWIMPGIDGVETARHIRGMDLKRPPAIIMLTAYDKKEVSDKLQGLEIKEVLSKPIFLSDLLNAILSSFGKAVSRCKREGETITGHVQGARILLVEDNHINQLVAQKILEKAGSVVTIAQDGREGIEKLILKARSQTPFDVVLMDIQMPVMDGYTASKEIRKLPDFKKLPIIAMTANAFARDRKKALDAGMNDHVAKPINVKELFKVLGEWVHIPKERQKYHLLNEETSSVKAKGHDPDDLPMLKGIDVRSGIGRAGGDRSLYEKLLRQFYDHHCDDIMKIKQGINEGDVILTARLAHTLKGVAGNIGAKALFQASSDLENKVKASDPEDIEVDLHSVKNELQQVLGEIQRAYIGTTGEKIQTTSTQPSVDIEYVTPVLDKLLEYLEEDDPEAIDYFLGKKDLLIQALPQDLIHRLGKKLRDFEFETVRDDILQFLNNQ